MRRLINKYADASSPYLFPILSPGREVGHEEYKAILRSYNNSLKKIGRALSRPIHLTSYVFRHTWATNALRKQVPLSIISQALGHTSEKTTRFYLASLEQSELNRANARVTEEVDLLLAAGGYPYSRNKGKSLFSIKITYNRLFSTEGLANVKNIIDKQSLLSIY